MPKQRGNAGTRPGPIGDADDRFAVQETFLREFSERGVIAHSAKAAGITSRTHYDWMDGDESYREAFYVAQEEATDKLETEARRRAHDGVEEPVGFYQGEPSAYVTKYSDMLMKFLLEGRRASVFKNRHEITGAGGGPIAITQIERVIVDPAAEGDEEDD